MSWGELTCKNFGHCDKAYPLKCNKQCPDYKKKEEK